MVLHYLYGIPPDSAPQLAATFDSEPQLLAYVRWATLEQAGPQQGKFEQGSALARYNRWDKSLTPLTNEDPQSVVHNPSPSML